MKFSLFGWEVSILKPSTPDVESLTDAVMEAASAPSLVTVWLSQSNYASVTFGQTPEYQLKSDSKRVVSCWVTYKEFGNVVVSETVYGQTVEGAMRRVITMIERTVGERWKTKQ